MNSPDIAEDVASLLTPLGSESFAASQRKYALRGKGTFLGVRMADVRAVAANYFNNLPDRSIETVHRHCEALFQKNVYELKTVAIQWAQSCAPQAEGRHIETYGRWLSTYVDEWMECDDLSTHPVASLLMMYPETLHAAKAWASDTYWAPRRAAAVSFVPPARKGMYIDHILDIAELLHKDEDRLVQKGVGWLLRASRKHFGVEVDDFLEDYKRTLSPLIAREARKG